MSKKVICVILAFALILTTFAACKKEEIESNDDTTNPTVIESVTNEDGEVVTDTAGHMVTEVYEEVFVTDSKGEQVTSDKGEKLTERVPHITENKATTSTMATTVTKPAKEEQSSDKKTETPGTTAENRTEEPTTAPTTAKPTTANPTTTKPSTTKPSTTTTTQHQTDLKAVANELAAYAKQYGLSIGLTYDYEGHKDNEYNGWWAPIAIVDDDYEYYKKRIRSRLNDIKELWENNYGEPKFWVQIEKVDENHYNLYIGY